MAGGRFYNAIHEFGHISFVPETSKAAAQFILIFVAVVARRLDLYGHRIFRRFGVAIHFGTVNICKYIFQPKIAFA